VLRTVPMTGGFLRERLQLTRYGGDVGRLLAKALRSLGKQLRGMPWIAVLVSVFAVRALISRLGDRLGVYDEGLLFTDAYLLQRGQALYRDFYANYPPGVFQIVRAILGLGLPAIWTTRILSFAVRVSSAICAGRLARKALDQPGCCWWTTASVLALQEGLGLTLYAYPIAVLCALGVILLWSSSDSTSRRAAMSPVLLGLSSYVRHDLFVYSTLGIVAIEGSSWLLRRRSFFLDSWAEARRFVAVLAGTLAVLWLPVLIRSGWYNPLHDLVLDQAQRVMPGRLLPVPPLGKPFDVGSLATTMPRMFADRTALCVVLGVAGAACALLALLSSQRKGSAASMTRSRLLALVAVFTLATLPQALQRSDYHHVVYGMPLALAALSAAVGRVVAQPMLVLAVLPWFVHPPAFARWEAMVATLSDRSDDRFISPQRRELVKLVERETNRDQALFVGCTSHQRIVISPVDLLYLTRRKNATRYVQFDPGTVTSLEGQKEMIADLERTRPPLAVLDPGCFRKEPNASQIPGASLLDAYLAAHYVRFRDVQGLAVLRRR
jgi:hypothetical protein